MVYEAIHLFTMPIARFLYGFRIYGSGHIPKRGGFIVAANHASFLDPVLIAAGIVNRSVYFMAKQELFRIPLFGPFIRSSRALPVRRGVPDRKAFRLFTELVKEKGQGLLVFPEGTRSWDGKLGQPRRGIGALCRVAGVAVIPATIRGTYAVWPRSRRLPRLKGDIELHFGPPVEWSDDELNASGDPSGALATLIMEGIAKLDNTNPTPPLDFWLAYRTAARKSFGMSLPGEFERLTDPDGSCRK